MLKHLFSIVFFLVLKCEAQFNRFYNYNVKDGLPGSEIYWVMQDSKGYIWNSGDMGVSRFDGYSFKNFSVENGLPDNSTFGVTEDKKGRLWFRASTGALSFFQNDTITKLACNDSLSKQLQNIITTSIYVDIADTVWLGTTSNLVVKIAPPWRTSNIQKIILSRGKYIYYLNHKDFIFGGDHPDTINIHLFEKGRTGYKTVNTAVDNSKKEILRFYIMRLTDNSYAAAIGREVIWFSDTIINSRRKESSQIITVCADGQSLITTSYNGTHIYSQSRQLIQNEPALNNKVVTCAFIDKENELWYSTEGHGIYCNQYRNFKYYTPENGLPDSKISAFFVNDTVTITGHLTGELCLMKKNIVSIAAATNGIISQNSRVTSIINLNNRLFIARIFGAYYLNGTSLNEIVFFKGKAVKQARVSRNGHLWLLNYHDLSRYNFNFATTDAIKTPLKTENFTEHTDGSVWLGAINGVSTYNNKKLKFLGKESKLLALRTVGIYFGPQGTTWIATKGGGVILKYKQRYIQINAKKGLAGNMCRCIMGDSATIWIGTNNGLSKISWRRDTIYTIRNYDVKEGLLTNEVNFIAKQNNMIYLAHNNGVAIFDPDSTDKIRNKPLVYIEKAYAADTMLLKDRQELPYPQENISILFKGLSFKDRGDLLYRYKLEGLDTNWVNTKYTSVNYQALPPGHYKFVVAVLNHNNLWSDAKSFDLTIIPAWWQTWWCSVGLLLLSIAIIFIGLLWYFKRKKKGEEEKTMLKLKSSEAELKALRAQMNPHFIFNAINSVQYFISGNDPKSSQKYLSKFAKLIRYVVDNSKPETIPLKTEIDALSLYLELESLRFENKFSYVINIHKQIDINYIHIPSMLIQPFVENAIWHGLMHKSEKEKGKVEISFNLVNSSLLECTILDNGVGRKRSKELKAQSPERNHKSVGIALTRERLDILNQIYNISLDYHVEDILDNNQVAGTLVKIQIPLN